MSIINRMTSPRRSKMKAAGAARGTAFATAQGQRSGTVVTAHSALAQLPGWLGRGGRKHAREMGGKTKGRAEPRVRHFWVWGVSC